MSNTYQPQPDYYSLPRTGSPEQIAVMSIIEQTISSIAYFRETASRADADIEEALHPERFPLRNRPVQLENSVGVSELTQHHSDLINDLAEARARNELDAAGPLQMAHVPVEQLAAAATQEAHQTFETAVPPQPAQFAAVQPLAPMEQPQPQPQAERAPAPLEQPTFFVPDGSNHNNFGLAA